MKITYSFVFAMYLCVNMCIELPDKRLMKLSRKRRQLLFPVGSTLTVAICMTAQTTAQPNSLFTEAINWGVSYDLPNKSQAFTQKYASKYVMQRRYRRELFSKMELIMNSMGYNGESCIKRLFCESSSLFAAKGENMIEEIIRTIFRYPQQQLTVSEVDEQRQYKRAHAVGRNEGAEGCSRTFRDCSVSLLDMALSYFGGYDMNVDPREQ